MPLNRVAACYIHAECLLAKAGGSKRKGRGISHPWNEGKPEWKERSEAEGCTSEARKPGESLARARGGAPLREYPETNAGRTLDWNADSSHLAVPVCGLFIANGVSPRQIESALSRRSVLSQALPLF
jgi:hypothetical protein